MRLYLLFIFFYSCSSLALELPTGLNATDREKIIKQLGIPTSSKFLSNPYPLGGYVGLELGVSYQIISIDEISLLGNQTQENEKSLALIELTFGKGLYNNVDIYFNFAPLNYEEKVNSYGGILKWGFYEAKFLPINFSLLALGSVFHVADSFVNQTIGMELMAGINVDNLAIYFGMGQLLGEGRFMGGAAGVVDTNITTKEESKISHMFIGLNFDISNFFLSAQMDRYSDAIFSAKLGYRY
ncbi:MAG: hypothetical protein KDD58_07580 [Bdellovibrionales bacterium]|nr:hypothetical protein [Bdellovibrionales bacterium]